jgi:outer membrane protein TolC
MFNTWTYANAQELTLEAILQKAVAASPDLQIAHQDIEIGKADINIAKADYFPTIKAQLDAEYLRDLEKQVSPVVVVGNTLIPSGTRYQNSVGLSLNHTLIDFGIRKRKVQSAKADVLSKAAIYDQSVRDMKLKLMDLYSEALLNYKAMLAHQAILDLAKQGYQMKRRLNTAGTLSKVDVATEAIQVAQSMDDIETFRRQLADNLVDISYYTHENYEVDDTSIAAIEPED